MIIGSGSASFEILRYLVERLPVMVTPRWVKTRSQPIAISNVLTYLVACLSVPATIARTLDIGSPDVVTYLDLMRIMAEERGLRRRLVIPVPVLTPRLSSLWIHLVTPVSHQIARPLAEGLRNPVVCRDDEAARLMPQRLLGAREAIRVALDQVAHHEVETGWFDALRIPGDPDWAGGTVFTDRREVEVGASPAEVFATVARIGGATGWYGAGWLWRIRGALDHLAGGPGLRRGRRDASRVAFGDAIDFWRVTGVEPGRRLALRAGCGCLVKRSWSSRSSRWPHDPTDAAWCRPRGSCLTACLASSTGTPCCRCTTSCSPACSLASAAPPRRSRRRDARRLHRRPHPASHDTPDLRPPLASRGARRRGLPLACARGRARAPQSAVDPCGRRVAERRHRGRRRARRPACGAAAPALLGAEHTGAVPGREFHDRQVEGPFAVWEHTHRMLPEGDAACTLEDRIEYALPAGRVGDLVGGPSIRAMLTSLFAYRHRLTADDLAAHAACHGERAMKVAVTGSSGLVGSALVPFLTSGGHEVVRLVRRAPRAPDEARWDPRAGTVDARSLEGVDAVVHLAGESIAEGRWSEAKKARLRSSRIGPTRLLAETLAGLRRKPKVLVSASAIGYYGNRGDVVVTEKDTPADDFLGRLCVEWEQATEPAAAAGIRVVPLRIGAVLSSTGGALGTLLPLFRMGFGGVVGPGTQYMSWIALDDLLGVIHHALDRNDLRGPVNAVALEPVTNVAFTTTLGRTLWRPTIVPVPAFALRAAFGEMADAVLLASTRVRPERLLATGYRFRFPELEGALRHLLGKTS